LLGKPREQLFSILRTEQELLPQGIAELLIVEEGRVFQDDASLQLLIIIKDGAGGYSCLSADEGEWCARVFAQGADDGKLLLAQHELLEEVILKESIRSFFEEAPVPFVNFS
jgi:hypothetical protein